MRDYDDYLATFGEPEEDEEHDREDYDWLIDDVADPVEDLINEDPEAFRVFYEDFTEEDRAP